ncbi:MAG: hypothetical protein RLZZ519_2590 [Bacteroidota bacterium]|jgi:hypothetical protein
MKPPKRTFFETRWEHRKQPLLSKRQFLSRQLRYFLYSTTIVSISLLIGTLGYSYFGGLTLVCGFYNASMILTGMGPVDPMASDGAKIFSSFYALYSGIAFLTTAAVLLAPLVHRMMHVLHLDDAEIGGQD